MPEPKLQPREIEILYWASRGYTYPDTAAKMGWNTQSVKNHASRLYKLLGADIITHAVAQALRRKIID